MSTNTIFTQCDICGRDIHYGNAILEISRNVEQHDHEEETGLHGVTVIDADPLVTACGRCGNSLSDRKEIWKHLGKELDLPAPANASDAAQQTEAGLPQTCSCCGIELEIGTARVSLIRHIAQVEWSDERDDSELYVIDGEDILSFCAACGNKMSSHRLQRVLHELIDDLAVPERMEVLANQALLPGDGQAIYERKSALLQRALVQADIMDRSEGV